MAGNLGTAGYKVNLDTKDAQLNADKLTKGLRQQQAQAQKTGSSFASLAKSALATAGAYIGVSRAFSALNRIARESIELAKEQNKVELQLELKYGKSAEALFKQAAALQKLTTVGDEATLAAQAQLGFFNLQLDTVQKLTPAMLDFAASGKDLRTVAELVGKAMAGEISTLKRYGIIMSEAEIKTFKASSETEKAGILVDLLDKKFKGLATTLAGTATGAMEQYKNATGDAKEEIGKLVDNSKSLSNFFKTMTGDVQAAFSEENISKFQEFTDLIGIMASFNYEQVSRGFSVLFHPIKTAMKEIGWAAEKLGIIDPANAEEGAKKAVEIAEKATNEISAIEQTAAKETADVREKWLKSVWDTGKEEATEAADHTAAVMESAAEKTQLAFEAAFQSMSDEAHNLTSQLLGIKKPEKPGLEGDSWERGWTSQFISDTPGGKIGESAKSAADEMARYEQELAEYTAEEQRLLDEQRALQVQAYDAMVAEGQRSFAEEQKALDAANIQELAAMQNEALAEIGQSRISNEKAALDTIAENNIEISEKFAAELAKAGKEYNASLTSAGVALTTALDTANRSMNTLNTGANQLKTTMQEIRDMQGGRGRGDDRNADPNSIFNDTGEGEGGGTSQGNAKSGAWNGGSRNSRNQMIERNGNQSRGGSPIVINVYPVRGQDEMMVAQMVEERILNLSRRNITTMAVGGLEGYRGI